MKLRISIIFVLSLSATTSFAETPPPQETLPLLSIEKARENVLANNLDRKIALERLQKASYLSKKAWAFILPTISSSASLVRNNTEIIFPMGLPESLRPMFESAGLDFPAPEYVTMQNLYQKNANVSISWTLLNGRSLPLIQNAYDMVDASKLGFEQAEGTLLYATSLAYLNIVTTCEQMRIRKRGLQIARQHRELALARKEVGDASEVMVLRAEVEVATANQIFLQAQNSLKMAKRSLATLMGMIDAEGDFSDFRVERKKSPTIETPKESSELIALAYQDRLDLKIAKLELKMSERFENETWMKFLPSVVGTGSWRWSDAEGFSGEKTNWQLGLAAQWLLFEGGNTYWELKERGHEIRASQLSVENKKLSIAREVRDAMEERDNARTNYEAAQVRVTLARKSALLVRTQYELGGGTQLEVLDANRAEADAETAVSIARLVWDIAEFGLAQIVKTPL